MTIHSDVEYECEKCGAEFIPLVKHQKCPKCGHKAPLAFESFVADTVRSALYNLSYGSFCPGIWGNFTLGDRYFDNAFRFLNYAAKQKEIFELLLGDSDVPAETARTLAVQFINGAEEVEPEYIRETMQDYLSRVLCGLKAGGRKFERRKKRSAK